jgi:small conductance mechanosensitive channel
MQAIVVHITQNLSRGGLLLAAVLVVLMAGALAFAMPGRLPLALDLLLQPGGLLLKLISLWCVALAARLILNVLLGQWRSNIDVPPEWRARRNQRFRSLQRVLGRLVNLCVISGGGIWMLSDIPGVRELSSAAVVAGGALLGALALVFQGLLRDFVAGLVVIFDDRYAIGDTVEINGLTGDVVDVGLLSTELRCADQRSVVMQNSSFDQVVNHSKLRSGIDIRIPLSPCRHNLESTLAIVDRELSTFAADPKWAAELLAAPVLRGVDQVDPTAITVSVMLMTTAGQQWALRRELLRQLVTCFEREGIPLASQEWNRREP